MSESDFFGSVMSMFVMLCIMLPFFILYVWSIIWAYKDANERGKSGCLVALLVFLLSWPVGLIIWLIFRPAKVNSPTHAGKAVDEDEYPDPNDYK